MISIGQFCFFVVAPVETGVQESWIPASAGMTEEDGEG
jgi:hypothetical protein